MPRSGHTVRKLDPSTLPLELKKWFDRVEAAKEPDRAVRLEVLRQEGHQENTPVELTLTYDPAYRYDREMLMLPNSPMPLGGLGLGYWIDAVVFEVEPGSPADGKLGSGDTVTAVRFKTVDDTGKVKPGEWDELKGTQWAWVDAAFQSRPPFQVDMKVKRGGSGAIEEVSLEGREDTQWPAEDRGLVLQSDIRIQKAMGIGGRAQSGSVAHCAVHPRSVYGPLRNNLWPS